MAKITKPSEIQPKSGISMLIYGQTGVGKTTFACGMDNPLLIDFDNGVNRIAPAHRTDTVQAENWCDVTGLSSAFVSYNAIVLDTYSKFLDSINAYVIEQPKMFTVTRISQKDEAGNVVGVVEVKKPSLNGYGVIKSLRQTFVKSIVNTGRHFIAVAQEVETVDEKTGKPTKRPALGSGKNSTELLQDLDAVGYMYVDEMNNIVIDFTPNVAYYTKCAVLGKIVVGRVLDANGNTIAPNVQIRDVIARWIAYQQKSVEESKAYETIMAKVSEYCASVKDAETATKASKDIANLDEKWDSKLQAQRAFRLKLAECGLKYNKDTKQFENVQPAESAE